MSRINRVPFGLQDLLGSQNLGANPSSLLQEVRPTLDLFPFWAAERVTLRTDNTVAINNSSVIVTSFTVPQGQAWIPLHVSCGANLATVGDTWATVINIGRFPNLVGAGNTANLVQGPLFTATADMARTTTHYQWTQRQVFPSGVKLDFVKQGGDITAADGIGSMQLLYVRLDT